MVFIFVLSCLALPSLSAVLCGIHCAIDELCLPSSADSELCEDRLRATCSPAQVLGSRSAPWGPNLFSPCDPIVSWDNKGHPRLWEDCKRSKGRRSTVGGERKGIGGRRQEKSTIDKKDGGKEIAVGFLRT